MQIEFKLGTQKFLIAAVLMATSLAVGIFVSARANSALKVNIAARTEAARPAKLSVIAVVDYDCKECSQADDYWKTLSALNMDSNGYKTISADIDEGKNLIAKYNITKLPSVIVSGETSKNEDVKTFLQKNGVTAGDAIVLKTRAPYQEIKTGAVRGITQLAEIGDSRCKNCYSPAEHEKILKGMGIYFGEPQKLDYWSGAGKNLAVKYKMKQIPTIVLTGDLAAYDGFANIWKQVGTVEKDGAHIFRNGVASMGVYRDLQTDKIVEPPKQ
ncbi:hypothetical protein EPN28_04730 [Patescibacteria group bacterium]|nr:MAG: hypothetical protein EPN28_04730 [Patescibacteria group bacterium]